MSSEEVGVSVFWWEVLCEEEESGRDSHTP